jgi:osmotically-inducible protein OsmY
MKKLALPLVALLALPLQGCFPIIATGVGAGALMVEDRRTSGTYIEDQGIELKAASRIDDELKDQVHINVTSFNRNVLLTGEAQTDALKARAEKIALGVPNARSATNEIIIASPTSFASRSNDTYLTSKIKARFIDANKFQANHVKVVTENGIAYLLGLVKRKEAADAVEIASTTGGVQKVVKVFEYID